MNECGHKVLVGRKVPDFTAPAVMPDNDINDSFNLKSYLAGSYGLIFFYPLDFTFVCPSEIIAHDNRLEEFTKRNTKIVGISVDSHYTHLAWKKTPRNEGGLGGVRFPLVADLKKQIAADYGILLDGGVALRGTFLVDEEGIVRHQVVNDLPLGRDVDEALRIVDALQFHEQYGEVCPAGWNKGKKGMKDTPEGVAEYLAENEAAL